ncbi:MAG: hypothetical protein OEV80_18095, partial [candidate division Zixibacteria bacterium]|nr:hypothetical protein [candidate division Zixibacteria bacterium]
SEQLTSQYLPMESERAVSDSLLTGRFAVSFWTATSLGLILPFVYLLVQSVKRNYVHIGLTAMSAVLINVAMWVKRYLIVVPTQYQANLPMARPSFEYTPTYTEWVVTLGSYVVAALILVFLLRLLPLFELPVVTEQVSATHLTDRPSARRVVMVLSLISGLLMIAWGVATREGDFGPVKWLTGIVFLLVIPMANCLIDITPREPEGKSKVQH